MAEGELIWEILVFAEFVLENWPTKEEFQELKNHLGRSSRVRRDKIPPRNNMNDPIGDFIIRIKNAGNVHNDAVLVPFSKIKWAIAGLLSAKGFVGKIAKKSKGSANYLSVELLYVDGSPKIADVKRVSKPGRRIYEKAKDIKKFRRGFGISVFSTPKGIRADMDAKRENLGGEFLFNIW